MVLTTCPLSRGPAAAARAPPAFRSALSGARLAPARASSRRGVARAAVAGVGDIGKYLGEAAKQIFSPTNSADAPDWEGTGSSFTGSIEHHENSAARLRALYSAVRSTREAITGCTDPAAANYDPAALVDDGTCNYVPDAGETGLTDDLRGYISDTLTRVFSANFKGDDTEPKDWGSVGYSYRGEPVSQRDIMRLLQYEKFVKTTLDKVESEEQK